MQHRQQPLTHGACITPDTGSRRRLRAILVAFFGFFTWVVTFQAPPAFARSMTVAATVDAFRNLKSGAIFECIDPLPFGCDRGDFYASVLALRGSDGTTVNCGPTGPTPNLDNLVPPDPAWACSTPASGLIAPVTLIVRVHDFDGRSANAIDGDDPVDIGVGFASESLINVPLGTTTSTFAGATGSITITFVASNVPITFTNLTGAIEFDPRLGETGNAEFSASPNEPGLIFSVNVVDAADTVVDSVQAIETPLGAYRIDWDGRNASGTPFPVGVYKFQISANDSAGSNVGNLLFSSIGIVNRADALRLAELDAPVWAMTSGPLHARVFAAQPNPMGVLGLYQGQNCDPSNRISILASRTWPAFTDFEWNGVMPNGVRAGQAASVGLYSLGLSQGTLSFGCLPLEIVEPSPIRTYIEADPAVPIDNAPSTIRVVSLSDANRPRRADRIAIFVVDAATLASDTAPNTPAAVCRFASMCTIAAPEPSSPDVTEPFAYRAVVSDTSIGGVNAPPAADTGWRISHRTTLGVVSSPLSTRPSLTAGVAQQTFGTFSLAHALDVGYRPGSGFDITTQAGWNDFMRAVRDAQRTMFGLHTNAAQWPTQTRSPSTLASTPQAYSQWVIPLPVSVTARTFTSVSSDLLCTTDGWNSGTFDAVGALHLIECRDNASGLSSPVYFTARGVDIVWHELHHALYGLADEYDGRGVFPFGYDLPNNPPNVFNNPTDCSLDPLGVVNGACSEISAAFSNMPFAPSGRFRLDPKNRNDVMDGNGSLEQGADVRRVRQRTTQCRGGAC